MNISGKFLFKWSRESGTHTLVIYIEFWFNQVFSVLRKRFYSFPTWSILNYYLPW